MKTDIKTVIKEVMKNVPVKNNNKAIGYFSLNMRKIARQNK